MFKVIIALMTYSGPKRRAASVRKTRQKSVRPSIKGSVSFSPKSGSKSKKLSVKSRFRAYVTAGARVAGVLVVGAVFVMLTTGIHPSLPFKSPAKHDAYVRAKDLVAPPAPVCSVPQKEDKLFSKCANYWVDFTDPTQKSLDELFNIRTDQPVVNNEVQLYTDNAENLRVEDGSLMITALNESQDGFSYTSARIDTLDKKDFFYGKLVVRAKLPSSGGTWPAIWMLPTNPKYASLSPASDYKRHLNDGEIDIAESVGMYPHLIYAVTHARNYTRQGVDHTYFDTVKVPRSDTRYHDYGVDWTPTRITMSVDGKPFFTYKKKSGADWRSWPFDQPFYLILNLAVGGTWAGRDGIDNDALPATMQVESIRYYSYIGQR